MKIRIAVAIDPTGAWNSAGWGVSLYVEDKLKMDAALYGVGNDAARYWIEAEIEVPTVPKAGTLDATVTRADEEQK